MSKQTSKQKKVSPPAKRKRGGQTLYTKAIATEICELLATGKPLTQICSLEHMPGWTTVWDWQRKYPEFAEDFTRARALGFDAIAEEALHISNTPIIGEEVELDGEGTPIKIKRGDMLAHRRLQVDTRLKLLARWDPKRYGDHLRAEVSGPDGGAIVYQDETARAARVAQLLELARQRESEAGDSE